MTGNYDSFFYFGKEKNAWARFSGIFPLNIKLLPGMLLMIE
jgi:hypothetical protein